MDVFSAEKKTAPMSSLTVGWVPALTPPTECRTSEEVNQSFKIQGGLWMLLIDYPILDTRISFVRSSSVRLTVPPLDSEIGWTGELWSKTKLLILEN